MINRITNGRVDTRSVSVRGIKDLAEREFMLVPHKSNRRDLITRIQGLLQRDSGLSFGFLHLKSV